MLQIRRADERGPTRTDWLDSRHSFSFGEYYDPRFTGFRELLVINEDRVAPGAGFPTHGHRDMEILSYIVAGALEHRDSLGNGSVIRPGELQRMSAGTGIRHSEYNASADEPVHFLQIWIKPQRDGMPAGYEQKALPPIMGGVQLDLIASPEGGPQALRVFQDVRVYRAMVPEGQRAEVPIGPDRHAWLQVVRGGVRLGDCQLTAGDGLAVSSETALAIDGHADAELLIFDLP